MAKSIPPLDLMWLLIETANAPTHVGAVMMFERPAGARRDLVSRIVASYRAAEPRAPFNQVPELLGVGTPRWRTVPHVDLDYHVSHLLLPPGADEQTFVRLIEDLHEPMLDRNRPGFRLWFIEGFADDRFAVYLKAHHSLIDGMSAMARIAGSLAPSPRARLRPPFYAVDVRSPSRRLPPKLVEQVSMLNAARRQTAALKDVSVGLVTKLLRRLMGYAGRGSQPFTAPHLPTNEPLRTKRSFATLQLSLEEMRAAGRAFGGTINDVAATIVDAGMHRYLAGAGKAPSAPLVAMCPVSLREADDHSAQTVASAIFVPLGAPDAPIAERMEQVIAGLAAGKDDMRAMSKDAAMMYGTTVLSIASAAEILNVAKVTGHLANFVLSNVPGSREEAYLAGARLAGVYPISALGARMGVNVTLASHAGKMGFGFVANGAALPNCAELARHTREAFEELRDAATKRAGGRGVRAKTDGAKVKADGAKTKADGAKTKSDGAKAKAGGAKAKADSESVKADGTEAAASAVAAPKRRSRARRAAAATSS